MIRIASAIAALGLLAFGTAANAADAPGAVYKGAPVYDAVSATSWAGGYIGLQAGWAWGDITQFDSTTSRSPDYDVDGFVGGVTVGHNWQRGMWVYGLEADFSFADIEGRGNTAVGWGCVTANGCVNEVDWFATMRGRIGYATGRAMPYITGGLAVGKVFAAWGGGCGGACIEETSWGWTVGGGVEWKIWDNWSAKAEYLYVDLGDDYNGATDIGFEDANFHVVRGGLNYWFN